MLGRSLGALVNKIHLFETSNFEQKLVFLGAVIFKSVLVKLGWPLDKTSLTNA